MSSTQMLKVSCPPRHGCGVRPVVLESGAPAQRVRRCVVDARVGDQQVPVAVLLGGQATDQPRSAAPPRPCPATPGRRSIPSRRRGRRRARPATSRCRPRARRRRRCGTCGPVSGPQTEVPLVALPQLLGGLGAAEVRGHLRSVAALQHREVVVAPPLQCHLHRFAPSVGRHCRAGFRHAQGPRAERVAAVRPVRSKSRPARPDDRCRERTRTPVRRCREVLCTSSNGVCPGLWESYRRSDSLLRHRKVTQWPTPPSVPKSPPPASARPPAVRPPRRTPRPRHPKPASTSTR